MSKAAPSLVRTKDGVANDDDVLDPANNVDIESTWGVDALATKMRLTVTARLAATGVETAGTFNAQVYAVLPAGCSGEGPSASVRPKVQRLGSFTNVSTKDYIEVEVGRYEHVGVILDTLSVGAADMVYVTGEAW